MAAVRWPLNSDGKDSWHYFEVSAVIAVCWMLALSINNSRSRTSYRLRRQGIPPPVWLTTLSVFGGVQQSCPCCFKLDGPDPVDCHAVGLTLLLTMRWVARRQLNVARRDRGRCMTDHRRWERRRGL